MCGVITYPYHNKISMQLQEFTAAWIKWVLERVFEIWHSQPYSSTMASWCVMSYDLIFGLLVTLGLYTALPLYYLEEMCHPDLIFWPALLFGMWEYISIFYKCLESPQWLLAVSKPKVRMCVTPGAGLQKATDLADLSSGRDLWPTLTHYFTSKFSNQYW